MRNFQNFFPFIKTKGWFTLIEMMASVTAFAVIIVMAFDVMGNIGVTRLRVSDKLDINKDLYFSIEKITALIKEWGGIDYEEYWNRRSIWNELGNGHYMTFSWFGNYGTNGSMFTQTYGTGFYYCRSTNGPMGVDGCLWANNSLNAYLQGRPQRYGQYALQFIDHNVNMDLDLWDEDGDGNIRNDEDDENLGMWPEAFSGGVSSKELYLIKTGDSYERTYFRWTVMQDPNAPAGATCNIVTSTGTGCLWNIQMLKLVGRDYGLSHSGAVVSPGRFDGITDTWECHPDFNCTGNNNLPRGTDAEWVNIFPDYINVKNVNFYLYPSKDYRYAWKESSDTITINPYVRLNMTIGFDWSRRKKIGATNPEITIATTINLAK